MAKKKTIKDVDEEKITKKKAKVKQDEVVDEKENKKIKKALKDDSNDSKDDEYEEVLEYEEETDEDYSVAKKGKKAKKKEGYFDLIGKELKKVVWPKFSEIIKYSLAVIIFCVLLCLFFEGINLLAAFIKELFS